MTHTREEVIERAKREFILLDRLVSDLTGEEWTRTLGRPETKDPWTVKDSLAHITYWKANLVRSIKGQRRPEEERGLDITRLNHLVYQRWHDKSPQEVLAWHRQVQEEILTALRDAPEKWFTRKGRSDEWPVDLDGHSQYHRVREIEKAVGKS